MKLPFFHQGDRLDRWLLGLSMLGMLLFLFLLNDNSSFFKSRFTNQGTQIGAVDQLIRDVRRRSTDDFVWLPLNDLESVYVGDSIFTGNKSSVAIRLTTGINLWIDPNSLVVLDQVQNMMKLDLRFGNLRGHLGSNKGLPLKLNINDQDLDLEGKAVEFSLNKKKLQTTQLKIIEGQVKLTESKSQKKLLLAKKHQLNIYRGVASIGSLAPLEEEPLFVRLDQWAENKNLWFSEKQKLKFYWHAEGPVDRYRLIVSTKPDLSQPLVNEFLKINGFEWVPSFAEGSLYWQVEVFKKGRSEASLQSEVIQWNLGLLTSPEWKNKMDPLMIPSNQWAETQDLSPSAVDSRQQELSILKWDSSIKAMLYRIEFGRDPQFKEKMSYEVKEKQWSIPRLTLGKYYARVRSESLGRPPSLWSHTLIVEVTDVDPDGLTTPLALKEEIETLLGSEAPAFQWDVQKMTRDFWVESSTSPHFTDVLHAEKVKGNRFVGPSGRGFGPVYFRIFPLSSQGRKGPVSKTLVWHIRPPGPTWAHKASSLSVALPRSDDGGLSPFPDTSLQWLPWNLKTLVGTKTERSKKAQLSLQSRLKAEYEKLSIPVRYILESSLDPNFPQLDGQTHRVEVPYTSFTLKDVAPGTYYYRVRSVYQIKNHLSSANDKSSAPASRLENPLMEIVSIPSPVLKVEVYESHKEGLQAPLIASKMQESALEGDKPALLKLQWEKRGVAAQFKVQVSEDPQFKNIVFEKIADQNQLNVSLKKPGTYTIRVAGLSDTKRVGPWSSPVSWVVKAGAPQLLPVDALAVALPLAETAVPPGHFTIKWNSSSGHSSFQVELSEQPQFSRLKLKEMVKERSYRLQLAEPGKFYVRVKGLGGSGVGDSQYSNVEMVRYLVKKPLQSPTLVLPKDKVSYILSKMERPEVWLEWRGDQLANQYVIEFSTNRNFKKILYTLKPKENRILLDNAAIRGKVFWRVKGLNDEQGLESPWSSPWSLSVVDIESDD